MREGFTDCGARGGHAACRVYGSRRHYSPLLHSPHTVGKVKNKPLDSWHQRELFLCFFAHYEAPLSLVLPKKWRSFKMQKSRSLVCF